MKSLNAVFNQSGHRLAIAVVSFGFFTLTPGGGDLRTHSRFTSAKWHRSNGH